MTIPNKFNKDRYFELLIQKFTVEKIEDLDFDYNLNQKFIEDLNDNLNLEKIDDVLNTLSLNNNQEDELKSYQRILENQIYFNQRLDYLFLIQSFLRENYEKGASTLDDFEGNASMFAYKFSELYRNDTEAVDRLEREIFDEGLERLSTFSIDSDYSKLETFSSEIDIIVGCCSFVALSESDRTCTSRIRADEFWDEIGKIFVRLQNICFL